MSDDTSSNSDTSSDPKESPESEAPVSAYGGTIGELKQLGILSPARASDALASLDRFDIMSRLGEGGMGIVLLARDSAAPAARVAIKLLNPELRDRPDVVEHFVTEAKFLAENPHRHLLPMIELVPPPRHPYFVTPWCKAGSLGRQYAAGQPMAEELTLKFAISIASALRFVHSKRFKHRDVKPSNILIDDEGQALLADFGLAKSLSMQTVVDGEARHFKGTAPYASPQVAQGDSEDTETDIYSFGATLYELLTGRIPYSGESAKIILNKIRAGPPDDPIAKLNQDAHPGLTLIAEDCMARSHRDRYASMEDVLADLMRVQKGEKPLGANGSLLRRLRRRLPRMRRLAAAAATAVAMAALVWFLSPARPHLEPAGRIVVDGIDMKSWAGAQAGSWDSDGFPDFFLTQTGALLVISGSDRRVTSIPITEPTNSIEISLVINVDGEGPDEAVASWAENGLARLAAFGQDGKALASYNFGGIATSESSHHGLVFSKFIPLAFGDLNKDGLRELIASANAGYQKRPRGLYVFNPKNADLLWTNEMAGPPLSAKLIDVNANRLIICGSGAPDNTNVLADGTDDSHSYIYALSDSRKDRLWHTNLGGVSTTCTPVVARAANGSGGLALFAWVQGDRRRLQVTGPAEVGFIVRLNPADGAELARTNIGSSLQSCTAHDLNRDGQDEIIATDRLGNLHVFDINLNRTNFKNVVSNKFDTVRLQIAGITNLTASRGPEYIVLTSIQDEFVSGDPFGRPPPHAPQVHYAHDIAVLVLDTSLRMVARHDLSAFVGKQTSLKALLLGMDEDGIAEIVTFTEFESPRILKLVK